MSQTGDPILGYGFFVNWLFAVLCGSGSTLGDDRELGCVEEAVASSKFLGIDLCQLEHFFIFHDVDTFEVGGARFLGQVLQLSVLCVHLLQDRLDGQLFVRLSRKLLHCNVALG